MTDMHTPTTATSVKPTMAKLTFGKLSEAWRGEASDFTPLLAAQLDALGDAIGIDLAWIGENEVPSTGGRRIDIVAPVEGEREIVVENQYGRADHDHLTRGLAYAVARRARGLVVVAGEHRDEFRSVAQYLNDLAEQDEEHGIAVWLVEARAVRIGDSAWAPMFDAAVTPNTFGESVERVKRAERPGSLDEFLARVPPGTLRDAVDAVARPWGGSHKLRLEARQVVLEARGPAVSGIRTVALVYADGSVMVPFGAYAGRNTGIPIPSLTTASFRAAADELFGFNGTEKLAQTSAGWLTPARVTPFREFCELVADAYATALRDRVGETATEETA